MNFKTLVKSVSPFTKGSADKKKKINGGSSEAFKSFTWDLTDIDLPYALTCFYEIKSVEKVKLVPKILQQFHGDEILLLQQLCERHSLTEAEMNDYLLKGRKQVSNARRNSAIAFDNTVTSALKLGNNINKQPSKQVLTETIEKPRKSLKDIKNNLLMAKPDSSNTLPNDEVNSNYGSDTESIKRGSSGKILSSMASAVSSVSDAVMRKVNFSSRTNNYRDDISDTRSFSTPQDSKRSHNNDIINSNRKIIIDSGNESDSSKRSNDRYMINNRMSDEQLQQHYQQKAVQQQEEYAKKIALQSNKRVEQNQIQSNKASQELINVKYELLQTKKELINKTKENEELLKLFIKYVANVHHTLTQENINNPMHGIVITFLDQNYRTFSICLYFI